MSRIDLSAFNGGSGNGYIVEEHSSAIVQRVLDNSVIESMARKENMNTTTKLVPRIFAYGDNVAKVVAEGATINESDVYLDSIVLEARKWASIMQISEEDLNDSFVDILNKYKTEWARQWARNFDNACLGVNADANGTTVPYESVYRKLHNQNQGIIQSSTVTFAQLNNLLSIIEQGPYFDPSKIAFIAHPSLMATLRGLVDNQNRPILVDPLGGTTPTLFGYPIKYTFGAQVSTVAGGSGHPFIMAANTDLLINGQRAGIETQVSRDAKFDTDGVLLKVRARRAFKCADADGIAILEKTA